ncbi:hypothetical protein [Lentilactobacillus kisonensis]|uniref:Phage-Barnase-EndoU-ColicinE5/D-RelE like nuclease 3 domain-containing protein n=2 Tax=Lentilactobacillus kisonensis TaxID=481722 RepID=H1LDZ7_9LACO|nr:hypothetical protein [Lentilactobacillus kisonensis]EHO52857.1 hypothetical protein HMPREF9104_00823 [Lentilactobacillus kisonensis F0435]KRL22560.1 hypothetical protein FC98_GL002449 [Lentilactobacillus kisonensis DSM 19906 = JCM 15041]
MDFSEDKAKWAIRLIQIAYQKNEIRPHFRAGDRGQMQPTKTQNYLRSHGLTYRKVLSDAVQQLANSSMLRFRDPSPNYFLLNHEGYVFDFLVSLYDDEIYIKFSFFVRNDKQFVVFESFHKTDKSDFSDFMDLRR